MRDHRKLRASTLADELALAVYRATRSFPKDELFGLSAQMRRAAVSVASNIVEGCARHTTAEYLRFLDMAYGSACELQYQLSLSARLGYLGDASDQPILRSAQETAKVLNGLIGSLRQPSDG